MPNPRILSGGQDTQRLPRLLKPEHAGEQKNQKKKNGLVDEIVEKDLEFAKDFAKRQKPRRILEMKITSAIRVKLLGGGFDMLDLQARKIKMEWLL